jgi:hypothetical protein
VKQGLASSFDVKATDTGEKGAHGWHVDTGRVGGGRGPAAPGARWRVMTRPPRRVSVRAHELTGAHGHRPLKGIVPTITSTPLYQTEQEVF